MAKEKPKQETIEEVMNRLNKTYGDGSVVTLDTKGEPKYDIISTGSISYDYQVLGIGGFAKTKLYELRGWEGVGKSSICGHAVAECQKQGGTVAYIDGEHAVDTLYFRELGVDTNKLILAQPSTGEEGFDIAENLIKSGKIDLLIIDSDSSLIPKSVIDNPIGESKIGKKASLNSTAYPKIKGALADNNVCCIVVSQYREKIGVMFGNPSVTQGGHALKFYADVILDITKSLIKEGDSAVLGNTTKMKALKNKMFPPYRQGEADIIYGKGIDKIKEILDLGNDTEVIKKWGKTITYKEDKYEIDQFIQLLNDNPEFKEQIKNEIIEKLKNS